MFQELSMMFINLLKSLEIRKRRIQMFNKYLLNKLSKRQAHYQNFKHLSLKRKQLLFEIAIIKQSKMKQESRLKVKEADETELQGTK